MIRKLTYTVSQVALFLFLLALALPAAAFAQEQSAAAENTAIVAPETSEAASAETSALPVVVELFSSQACVFCPQADRFFAELVKQPNIIGLSCHVDYFDVKIGSLSQPFCTERQMWYADAVGSGPLYTPQVILQGFYDVVGYKTDNLVDRLQDAAGVKRAAMQISARADKEDSYTGQAALSAGKDAERLRTWVALFDKPHKVTVASGRNAGQAMTYYNIVSDYKDLGPWPGEQVNFKVVPVESQAGFVLAVQDQLTGRIVAAGQYLFPQEPEKGPLLMPEKPEETQAKEPAAVAPVQ